MVLSTGKVAVRLFCPLQTEIKTKKSIWDDENIFKSLCTADLLKGRIYAWYLRQMKYSRYVNPLYTKDFKNIFIIRNTTDLHIVSIKVQHWVLWQQVDVYTL